MKLVSDHALKSIVCTHGFGRLVISPLRAQSVRRYSTELNRCERDAWLLGARPHHQVRLWPKAAPIRPPKNGSAYCGTPALHPRTGRAVGLTESDPKDSQ
jgi:hypothetical protein